MRILVLLFSLTVLLCACVTPEVVTSPTQAVDFRQYKTIHLIMTDQTGTPYSREGLPMFEGLLKGKLASMGYSFVEADADMTVEVRVTEFTPGNRAARTIVGFGAGRALLTFIASFRDNSGKLITEMRGGKSYHGMELADNPLFYSDEKIRMGLIQESVIQLGTFIQSNGKIE